MDYLQPTLHLLLLSCFKVRAKLLFKETTALGGHHLLMTVGVFGVLGSHQASWECKTIVSWECKTIALWECKTSCMRQVGIFPIRLLR
jgi:hypothetical protein